MLIALHHAFPSSKAFSPFSPTPRSFPLALPQIRLWECPALTPASPPPLLIIFCNYVWCKHSTNISLLRGQGIHHTYHDLKYNSYEIMHVLYIHIVYVILIVILGNASLFLSQYMGKTLLQYHTAIWQFYTYFE